MSYGRAHKIQVLTTNYRKAERFIPSKENTITFTKDYGFEEARVELLHTSGTVLESAEVLMKSGKIAEAVKTLLTTARAPVHKRRAVGYLLAGFWKYQSFGMERSEEHTSELQSLV